MDMGLHVKVGFLHCQLSPMSGETSMSEQEQFSIDRKQ